MGIFRRKVPYHYVPIHPDNVRTRDWLILLEVGTIVGDAPHNIRVAQATQEKVIARRYNIFLRREYFIILEGYDPHIHALYFCPQLYKRDRQGNLIALEGEEIGELLVRAFRNGTVKRQVWYHPSKKIDIQRIIGKSTNIDLDTLVGQETIPNYQLQSASGPRALWTSQLVRLINRIPPLMAFYFPVLHLHKQQVT